MSESHFNTAIAAISGLELLVKHCIQGLDVWRRANDSNTSFTAFKYQLSLECAKLDAWARQWGIKDNRHLEHRRFRGFEVEVSNCLRLIYQIALDLNRLDNNFPILSKSKLLADSDQSFRIRQLGKWISSETDTFHEVNSPSSMFLRIPEPIKWALQEEKAYESLNLLKALINELCESFPPAHFDPTLAILLDTSLESRDPNALANVGAALDPNTTLIGRLAEMKSIVYRTVPSNSMTIARGPPIRTSKLVHGQDLRGGQYTGTYDGLGVLVERKQSTTAFNDRERRTTLDRSMANVVHRLKHPHKPDEWRTLRCKGMTSSEVRQGDQMISTYTIVYDIEGTAFPLRELLHGRNSQIYRPKFSLGRRFHIAQTLARAVLYLHLADWLHKGIRSSNVIFFGTEEGLGSTLPYLTGFEYSRPDAPDELTEDVIADKESALYRHPNARKVPVTNSQQLSRSFGNFTKIYDIYSLGVVLMELGLFKPATDIAKHDNSTISAENDTRDPFKYKAGIEKLRFSCGDTYADVVSVCINGFFEDLDLATLDREFYDRVVRKLELCKV